MKGLFVLRILMIASMLVVLLVAVSPAFADTPGHWVNTVDETSTWLANTEDNPCDFDIVVHEYGTFRGNYWIDDNGQLTRAMDIYAGLKQTLSAHGKTVNMQIQGPIHYDVISENHFIMTSVGTNSLITVPGYGKIFGGAGQIVEEIKFDPTTGEVLDVILSQVGNINFDNFSAVCKYLSS
jgi:hypothetical protein